MATAVYLVTLSFLLSYQGVDSAQACGGDFTSLNGIIQSPNYPGYYGDHENCVYLITAPDNYNITLTFTNFGLEHCPDCRCDYVEVRDGDSDKSPLLGRYCGQTLPNLIRTSGRQMWIKFVSDGSGTGSGFRANYTAACGGIFTSLSGIIQLPNYPGNYRNHENCVYLITAPDNHNITLTFIDFGLEYCDSDCSCDYVEVSTCVQVRDGNNDTSPLLGRYCGQTLPNRIRTFGHQMWIKFVSDGSGTGSGFRATYTAECGGIFTSLSGIIQSPIYPDNYRNHESCTYLIKAPVNQRITLTFTNISLPSCNNCGCDYVEVRDGDSDTSPRIGRYCGQTLPNRIRTVGHQMWIKFVSNSGSALSGFRATYIAECESNFTSLSDIIQSPNYPGNYGNNERCVYLITAPDNHRITLTFTNITLPSCNNCGCDYVEVRDGDNDTSPLLGRYCGQTLPNRIRTFGHQMWIVFYSNDRDTRRGFRATYIAAVHQDAFLLISSTTSDSLLGDIFRVDPETMTNYSIGLPMSNRLYNPIAVDYDPVNKTIYWTEVGIVNRVRASSLSGSGVRTLKDAGEGSVLDGLAVDVKSRLIFYTDTGKDEIVMMTMNTLAHKTVINSNLDNPRAIVLNTADGVMFWADRGTPAKIERASYDGTNRQILITDDLGIINALALDVPNNRLYWVDALTDKVEVVDMEGKGRRVLFNTSVSFNGYFFGLALFQDVLYTISWGEDGFWTQNSSLHRLHLTSGKTELFFNVNQKRLNDIHVNSGNSIETSPNGCGDNNGGCSVFCTPLPGNSSKCTCPDGQTLTSDQKTCVDGPNGCGNNNGGCSVFCIPLPGNSSKCACPDGQTLTSDLKTCVDGQQSSNADYSKPTPDIAIIAGGSAGGVCFLLVLTVCIVCIVKRKRTSNVTVRTPAPVTDQRVEGNRYSVPIADRNSQVFPNRVYDNQDTGPRVSGIYDLVE